MKKVNEKGFTLAELLIVVAVIAVLVAIAIPTFANQLEKSKQAVDVANLRSAFAAAKLMAMDGGYVQVTPGATEGAASTSAFTQFTADATNFYYDPAVGNLVTELGSLDYMKGTSAADVRVDLNELIKLNSDSIFIAYAYPSNKTTTADTKVPTGGKAIKVSISKLATAAADGGLYQIQVGFSAS